MTSLLLPPMSTSLLFPGAALPSPTPALASSGTKPEEAWWDTLRSVHATPRDGHICGSCGTDIYVEIDEEEVTCTQCGTHLGYLIDCSAEYRWFGADDRNPDPSRVGNPLNPLLPESSLGTRILYRPGDSKAMRRIRQYHMWNIMPYRERTLWNVFEGLTVRASNAGISGAIIDEAKQLYAQVSPLCICRGPQKDALLAACLFESLKRHDTPRRPVEIAGIFQIDAKLITRGVKQFSGLLETHLHAEAKKVAAAPPRVSRKTKAAAATAAEEETAVKVLEAPALVSASHESAPKPVGGAGLAAVASSATINFKHFLEPALSRLETPRTLHGDILATASRVGDMVDELGICPETTPSSLAASALAITCEKFGVVKTPAEIAKVCSISAATLQKCLKRIEPWKPHLFRSE